MNSISPLRWKALAWSCLKAPPVVPESALYYGRDNRYVLETILGYSPEQIAALAAEGVLT